ncbi:hypothetical protein N665_0198s0166 [Sinapis alba]|nr:hypothetical protein N665_0198s0166 [Sinapis alba]
MGIDIQRIAKIELLPREYFCAVCQLLINPNEALQAICGHLYCKPCLAYVASTTRTCPYDGYMVTETYAMPLMDSNKELADTIGKTVVYCSYQNSGCTWVGSLADSWFHCYRCAFGNSLVMSSCGGINIPHCQQQEHVQVCLASVAMATTQASVAMFTSQASAQVHDVASAMMNQEQWYQQPYQQYYQNYVGDYMQQQSFAPHNQVIYVQVRPEAIPYVAQTHSQMQPQPHVQSQSLAMHQPHDAFPSPQDNTVQDSLAQNTTGQSQSNQPHASWTVQNPQPNQTNQVGAPPDNINVSHVLPPLPTIQKQQPSLPSQLTRSDQYTNQMVLKYGGALAPESSDMHSSQQPFSNPSLSQQHRAASTTDHNQLNHEGPSYHPHIALQEHQPMSPILGLQPNMNHFSATAPQMSLPAVKEDDIQKQVHWVSWGQNKVIHIYGNKDDEAVMEAPEAWLTTDSTNTVYGVNRAAEVTTIKFDHKLKGKLIDGSGESSVHGSSIVVEGSEIKSGHLGKQVVEEDIGTGWEDLGKSLLVEKKGINNDPSLDGTPLMNPTLLDQDGLGQLSNLQQRYLMLSEKSRACSGGSLDRGFDQRSLIMTQEKHETGFELRHALRSSEPSMDLGEGQFRRRPGSPISEHLRMPSHGYGTSWGISAMHRSEFKGIGDLQMGEKVIAADMIGPVDNSGLRLGDVGSQSSYTLQGYPGDGGSFPVKILVFKFSSSSIFLLFLSIFKMFQTCFSRI